MKTHNPLPLSGTMFARETRGDRTSGGPWRTLTLAVVVSALILAGSCIGVREAAAGPIPPGAPTDGLFHTVQITESGTEGITMVEVGTDSGLLKGFMRKANGLFTLGIAIQPGIVTINDAGSTLSDRVTLVAIGGGIDLAAFFSDATSPDDTTAESELFTVFDGVNTPTGQHSTKFIINSPAETIPEPSTLLMLAMGLFSLIGARALRFL